MISATTQTENSSHQYYPPAWKILNSRKQQEKKTLLQTTVVKVKLIAQNLSFVIIITSINIVFLWTTQWVNFRFDPPELDIHLHRIMASKCQLNWTNIIHLKGQPNAQDSNWKGSREDRWTQSYPRKWRGYFQDLNLWVPSYKAESLSLRQGKHNTSI